MRSVRLLLFTAFPLYSDSRYNSAPCWITLQKYLWKLNCNCGWRSFALEYASRYQAKAIPPSHTKAWLVVKRIPLLYLRSSPGAAHLKSSYRWKFLLRSNLITKIILSRRRAQAKRGAIRKRHVCESVLANASEAKQEPGG